MLGPGLRLLDEPSTSVSMRLSVSGPIDPRSCSDAPRKTFASGLADRHVAEAGAHPVAGDIRHRAVGERRRARYKGLVSAAHADLRCRLAVLQRLVNAQPAPCGGLVQVRTVKAFASSLSAPHPNYQGS